MQHDERIPNTVSVFSGDAETRTEGQTGETLLVILLKFKKSGSESSLIAILLQYELRRKIIVVSLFYN
jgi:hypothetical protein